MLFKIVDLKNKFLEYVSFCLSPNDVNEIAYNSDIIINKLYKSNSFIAKNINSYSMLSYNPEEGPITLQCYKHFPHLYCYLKEIPSLTRRQQIEKYKQKAAEEAKKMYYFGNSNETTGNAVIYTSNYNWSTNTFTMSYTPQATLDGYVINTPYTYRNNR